MPLNPALLEQVTCEYIVHRPILVVKKNRVIFHIHYQDLPRKSHLGTPQGGTGPSNMTLFTVNIGKKGVLHVYLSYMISRQPTPAA